MFDAMLAKCGTNLRREIRQSHAWRGGCFRALVQHGAPEAYVEQWRSGTLHLSRTEVLDCAHVGENEATFHLADICRRGLH